ARTHVMTNGGRPEDLPATSPALREHAMPITEASCPTLPAIHTRGSPSRDSSTASPRGEKPSLPSLHSHLKLIEASGQPYEALTNGSANNGSGLHSELDRSRLPAQFRDQAPSAAFMATPRPNGQYAAGPGKVAEPLRRDAPTGEHFRPNRELPTLSPSPGPNKHGSDPYYYYQRPGKASVTVSSRPAALAADSPHSVSTSTNRDPSPETRGVLTSMSAPEALMDVDPSPVYLPARYSSAPLSTGAFKCDFPDCPAPPFHTQYLLKGFKRKNEMIRHGLVHSSPGYVCPFCPDREHKYPRPDNLQRSVHLTGVWW
ncbi:MAG: hypothetical protein M1838_003171, partial [Thelocarpon superellum]